LPCDAMLVEPLRAKVVMANAGVWQAKGDRVGDVWV